MNSRPFKKLVVGLTMILAFGSVCSWSVTAQTSWEQLPDMPGARWEPGTVVLDGKIFVLPMDDCIRIRTGERGEEAI